MKNDRFDVEYIGPLERDRKTLQGAFAAFLLALVESFGLTNLLERINKVFPR